MLGGLPACLPASLSPLHSALQLPCACVWESTCLCVFVWMCVCQKRGESGFRTAPPKETVLFVIFLSSRQREHQPDHLDQPPAWSIADGGGGDISLSLSVCLCECVCTCVWAGERVRGGEMKGPGEEGCWVPLSLAFSLSLFPSFYLSLSLSRDTNPGSWRGDPCCWTSPLQVRSPHLHLMEPRFL